MSVYEIIAKEDGKKIMLARGKNFNEAIGILLNMHEISIRHESSDVEGY